jgi:hypothetical protein
LNQRFYSLDVQGCDSLPDDIETTPVTGNTSILLWNMRRGTDRISPTSFFPLFAVGNAMVS